MKNQAIEHLQKTILPYWNRLADFENGGFYGYVDQDLKIEKQAQKGVILHSRILWFYSSVYSLIGGEENLKMANHAFDFLYNKCFDEDFFGVYWMMNYDGSVADCTKNAYCQAFAIYGLCAYYKATKNPLALSRAYQLFQNIETFCVDEYGYLEAFERDWKKPVESAICDQGVVADKTMNTLLHVLEAYTLLLEVDNHPLVAQKIYKILKLFRQKVYYADFERLEVFFDTKMSPLGDIHSYGHDIEATWLLDLAAKVLSENINLFSEEQKNEVKAEIEKTFSYTSVLAKKILNLAYNSNSLDNESRGERANNAKIDEMRVWWVQAEAVVGFVNEFEKNNNAEFLTAAKNVFNFIEEKQVDKREGSEWFGYIDKNGVPKKGSPITEAWKCPYHNGRMCLELIKRF